MYHGDYFLALASLVPIVLSSLFLSIGKVWLSGLFFVMQILSYGNFLRWGREAYCQVI